MIGLKPRIQHLKKHIMVFFFIFGKEGQKEIENLNNFMFNVESHM